MGYSEHYKKREEKMNLGKKYKQLFEGKIRSNDGILLTENDALELLPIVKKDAKLKQLGMTNLKVLSGYYPNHNLDTDDLKIMFKSRLPAKGTPEYDLIADTILDLIPDGKRISGLRVGKDKKTFIVSFSKQSTSSSKSTSQSSAEVTDHDEMDDTIEFEGTINGKSWTATKEWQQDGAIFTSVYDENDDTLPEDEEAYDEVITAINDYMEKEGVEGLGEEEYSSDYDQYVSARMDDDGAWLKASELKKRGIPDVLFKNWTKDMDLKK